MNTTSGDFNFNLTKCILDSSRSFDFELSPDCDVVVIPEELYTTISVDSITTGITCVSSLSVYRQFDGQLNTGHSTVCSLVVPKYINLPKIDFTSGLSSGCIVNVSPTYGTELNAGTTSHCEIETEAAFSVEFTIGTTSSAIVTVPWSITFYAGHETSVDTVVLNAIDLSPDIFTTGHLVDARFLIELDATYLTGETSHTELTTDYRLGIDKFTTGSSIWLSSIYIKPTFTKLNITPIKVGASAYFENLGSSVELCGCNDFNFHNDGTEGFTQTSTHWCFYTKSTAALSTSPVFSAKPFETGQTSSTTTATSTIAGVGSTMYVLLSTDTDLNLCGTQSQYCNGYVYSELTDSIQCSGMPAFYKHGVGSWSTLSLSQTIECLPIERGHFMTVDVAGRPWEIEYKPAGSVINVNLSTTCNINSTSLVGEQCRLRVLDQERVTFKHGYTCESVLSTDQAEQVYDICNLTNPGNGGGNNGSGQPCHPGIKTWPAIKGFVIETEVGAELVIEFAPT